MHISKNDPVKNVANDKPVKNSNIKQEEPKKVKDTAMQTGEQVIINSKTKVVSVPNVSVFEFENPIPYKRSNVSISKSIVDKAVELDFGDKAGLVKASSEFTQSLDGMDNKQLLEVADYIRHLLQETLGTDDVLGGMQSIVFDKMNRNMDNDIFKSPSLSKHAYL